MNRSRLIALAILALVVATGCTLIYAGRSSRVTTIDDESVSGESNKVGKIEIKPR